MFTSEESINSETKRELNLKNVESSWISLKGPKRLGCYSSYYNEENIKIYCPDKSFLGYLDLPDQVSINCLKGYDPNRKYGHLSIGSTYMLRWVLDNEAILKDYPTDFICYNGLLKDMMRSCCIINDWEFFAIKIKGKIIMIRFNSSERNNNIDEESEWSNKSTYVAYNLRCLITKTDNGHESSLVEEGQSCHGVFHSRIGFHRILHAGWLDCVESKQELNKPFNEIKFCFIKKFHNIYETFSNKQANTWWSLATLAGVETIICTKCDQNFTVESIDKLNVRELIPRERQMEQYTSLNLMLDYIKSIVREENQSYNFYYNSMDKKLTGSLRNDSDENLLPSWYIDGQLPHES